MSARTSLAQRTRATSGSKPRPTGPSAYGNERAQAQFLNWATNGGYVMRTTISAAALLLAIGLAGPAFAQATEGGKQPAKEGVQAGQEPSAAKDKAK